MALNNKVVVIDFGCVLKAGFGGDDQPKIIRDYDKEGKQKILSKGMITDKDYLTSELRQIFSELGVNPSEHPFAITEPANPVLATREAICEILFDEFKIPFLWCACQPYLSFLSLKKPTGCVIECGAEFTQFCCIVDHQFQKQTANRIALGSNVVNQHIRTIIEQVHKVSEIPLKEVIELKEKTSYVAGCSQVFEMFALQNSPFHVVSEQFTLSGKEISLGNERFQFAEPLFQPHLADLDLFPSVSGFLWNSLYKSDLSIQRLMLDNIIVTGGSSKIPGFLSRFKHDLTPFVERNIRVAENAVCINVSQHPQPDISAWLGASIATTAENFLEMGLHSAEYMEQGPDLIHSKCY